MPPSLPTLLAAVLLAGPALAQNPVPCGGSFATFRSAMEREAIARGHEPAQAAAFFRPTRQDPRTLNADRRQGVFQLPFVEFARRLISQNRMDNGRANLRRYGDVFDKIKAEYGVSPGVLTAFWALETDYGAVQGDFNTVNALMTLAHDCRRPDLFRPQVFAALELFERGRLNPATTRGAWAGEIGMVQMLPRDILEHARDGDADGRIDLTASPADALVSGAAMLRALGWRAGEPWMHEINVPDDLDWFETGLNHPRPVVEWKARGITPRNGPLASDDTIARVLLPQGRKGPAFLAYPNYDVYFEWNQSFVYVATAAYFATRLEGARVFDAGNPDPGLGDAAMRELQSKLVARGHDVGGIDGILGAKTREAVQIEQQRLGLPADAWPTQALLSQL